MNFGSIVFLIASQTPSIREAVTSVSVPPIGQARPKPLESGLVKLILFFFKF